jgi:hypothetical protein
MNRPDQFNSATPAWEEAEQATRDLGSEQVAGKPEVLRHDGSSRYAMPPGVLRAIADIATQVWKAKVKMTQGTSGEVREEMKRVYRHIEGVLDSLQDIGLEVKGHTGDAFDYGLPLKVVATQPTPGITRESVLETIRPTIYWQKQIIQMGEVVIATPASPTPTV